MAMKTSSAKAKGRNLQKYVVSRILHYFKDLETDDVSSRSMGASGEDILLSPRARRCLPISLECKSHARYAIYKDYLQAQNNCGDNAPVVIIKQNNSKPLALMDLEYFLKVMKDASKV